MNNKQPTTNNQQPTTNNQQPTTNNQQPTTNNKQMSIQCPTCLTENPDTNSNCFACGTPLVVESSNYHLPSGTILQSQHNQYRIEKKLGAGGFGITYKGIELNRSTTVAIKENWPENGSRQNTAVVWPSSLAPKDRNDQINGFIREGQFIHQCQHPNIVKIYDWFTGNNTAYIAMEFLPGKSLCKILEDEGPLPEARVKKYLLEIARALQFIHSQNLLHRDIKPENIILDSQDRAVLIDFGNTREFIANKTQKMTQILTPGYAPIEQYGQMGRRGPGVDIYAFCASMYELLTGKLPPSAPDRLQNDPLEPPRKIIPNLNPITEKVILTGMKMRVEERFQTAETLIEGLEGNYISPLVEKARQLTETGELAAAVKLYQQCLGEDPHDSQAAVELAVVSVHLDDRQAAQTAAERAIKLKPKDARGYGILGLVSCRQSNWSGALRYLQQGANLASNESWIQANLAWALGKNGDWQQAQIAANQALQLNQDCPFTLGLQAWIRANQEDWKPVIRYSRQGIFKAKQSTLSPELASWVYPCLTIALDRAVVTQQAPDLERCLQQFKAEVPNSAFPWGFQGWQQCKQGLWQNALTSLEQASKLEGVTDWILLNQAIVREQLQDIAGAIEVYKAYQNKFDNSNAFVWYRLGTLYGQIKEWKAASFSLNKAIQLKPDYGEAYHNLGWVLLNIRDQDGKVENPSQVLPAYRQAVKLYKEQGKQDLVQQIEQAFQRAGLEL